MKTTENKPSAKLVVVTPEQAPEYCFIKDGDKLLYLGKDKKYASDLSKKVNLHDKLVSQLSTAYAMLQVLSNKDVNIAVATDATRASLRNLLAEATDQDAETIQNQREELARNK